MTSAHTEAKQNETVRERALLTGRDRRTLEAIFRHLSAQNLEWRHVVALFETIGEVHQKGNNEFTFEIDKMHFSRKRSDTKDLTGAEVIDFRRFLTLVGWSTERPPQPTVDVNPSAPGLLIQIDHHEARIFKIDIESKDTSEHVIRPFDPHHFLHHLAHKNQDREQGQRTPEDITYYERISESLSSGGDIIVVGHGTGKSNAADHLCEYLRTHHNETYRRIIREIDTDLSSITTPQLLHLAQQVMREG